MQRLWPEPGNLSPDDVLAAYATGPTLRVNFVSSTDGAVTVAGRSAGLSTPTDQRMLGLLRQLCDVLLVGAGTIRVEGYGPLRLNAARRGWRRGREMPEVPVLAIVSSRLELDPSAPLFTEATRRPLVITHHGSPIERRKELAEVADVLVHGDAEVDLAAARANLAERVGGHILCEGGPHLFGALAAADLVDELCLTVAPLLAGPGADRITAGPPMVSDPHGLTLRHILAENSELFLRYTRP